MQLCARRPVTASIQKYPTLLYFCFWSPTHTLWAIFRFSASSVVCILHMREYDIIPRESAKLVLVAVLLIYRPPAWSLETPRTRTEHAEAQLGVALMPTSNLMPVSSRCHDSFTISIYYYNHGNIITLIIIPSPYKKEND